MSFRQGCFRGLNPKGFHRIAYTEWGAKESLDTAICVHGLTRNGRDFDFLAQALMDRWRVFCPDIAGRGRSDDLPDAAFYTYPQYCADMAGLIAHSGADQIDWIGTSMGGLIGMMLAAQPNSPIRRLVINDIGPFIPKAALERLSTYVGKAPYFNQLSEAETYLRQVLAPWGSLPADAWRHIMAHGTRPGPNGQFTLAYDPKIGAVFDQPIQDVALWEIWDRIRCPVLLLRGSDSDLLTKECAAAMQQRGPKVTFIEWPNIGHAPGLMTPDQIGAIQEWLRPQN